MESLHDVLNIINELKESIDKLREELKNKHRPQSFWALYLNSYDVKSIKVLIGATKADLVYPFIVLVPTTNFVIVETESNVKPYYYVYFENLGWYVIES